MLVNRSWVHGQQQLAAQPFVVSDVAVMHEKPIAPTKGVAIGLLDRCSGSGPHMRQEQWAADLGGKLEQVLIAPGRNDAAKQRRLGAVVIPAQPGPVTVGYRHVRGVPAALLDQRPLRVVQQFLGRDRGTQVCDPTTHGILFSRRVGFIVARGHPPAGRIQRCATCSRAVSRISRCTKPSLRITGGGISNGYGGGLPIEVLT